MTRPLDGSRRQSALKFGALTLLIAACFLMGGASRADVKSLVVLQPLSVVCLAIFLADFRAIRWNVIRYPLLLLTVLAAIIAIQLVPLPPSVWTNLPGHEPFAATARTVGLEQPWRPISLSPDLTLGTLVGLCVPFAALVGFASLPADRTRDLLPVLIVGGALSALLGLAQMSSGVQSRLYLFEVTNRGLPVGFLANRNHQALLLAMLWPMLAVWASFPAEPRFQGVKRWICAAVAIFLLPLMLATGSRAGLVLAVVGLAMAFLFWRGQQAPATAGRWGKWLPGLVFGLGAVVLGAAVFLSRDEAVQRAAGMDLSDESRLEYMPTLLKITWDFFPVGSGFGGFDPLFRYYEPEALLSPSYLNHAHNDLLEVVLAGGLAALVLLGLFVAWIARRGIVALRRSDGRTTGRLARLALGMIAMMLLSSLVDYPLRTPLLAVICAVACGWLADTENPQRPRPA
ncbi:MAG TPA: O-antigen ligase family protein [Croceibacterium sp.]|nr:O-antigen ligase family protein [Croceibacterium sp.]